MKKLFLVLSVLLSLAATHKAQAAPEVGNITPTPDSTVRELTFINVIFSDAVLGVNASDLLINSNPAASVTTNNPNDYTFYFPQPPNGPVAAAWAMNHEITDTQLTPFVGTNWNYTLDPNAAPRPAVVISEFMADNGHGIQDEDGTRADWIELLNRGPLEAGLSGWFLTDDRTNLTKWQFPAGMPPLAVNGYLRIWASQKDRRNPLAPLHTNFRLAKEAGNFLALVDARTNIVSSFNPYPAQQEDVSYGRDRVDPNIVGYFNTPTPGAQNTIGGSGFAPDPVYSLETGIYTNAFLTLTISAPSGQIRYTRDGTVPTSGSTLYTGPVSFTNNSTFKARVFQTGLFPSRVVARNFIFLDGTTADFNSNLPLMIISTDGRPMSQDVAPGAARTRAAFAVIDTFRGRSSTRLTPDFHGLGDIEVAGQTSAGFGKRPYRFEIQDELFNDLDVSLLGMPADSDWRLRNPYNDKTLLNDFMGFELFEKMGQYSVRRRYVETFVDTDGGRLRYPQDYIGVEVLTEHIKQGDDRVDIPEITPYATNEPAITGGYIFKKDKDSTGDLNFNTTGATNGTGHPVQALKLHEPRPNLLRNTPGITTSWPGAGYTPSGSNQMNYLVRYLNRMESALYATNWLTLSGSNHYSHYLDVDSFVDTHWVVEFTKQIDGYRLSGFFTKDRNGKVKSGPIWDWNLAYGNANYLQGGITNGWYYALLGAPEHIWLRRLIGGTPGISATGGDPDFNQKIADRWSVLRTNVCGLSNTLARIDELSTMLSEAAARDLWGKWRSGLIGVYTWPNPDGTGDGRDVDFVRPTNYLGSDATSIIWQMKKWMTGRFNWIDSQFTRMPTFNTTDGMVTDGFQVTISGPPGFPIYYTLDGTDPRGATGVTNGVLYAGPITVNGNIRVVARAKRTNQFYNTWSGPAAVSLYTSIPQLRITEIMYHPLPPPPGSTNTDEDFEYIEVKNTGDTPLNVNRFSLGGGIQFEFPNVVLQPGEYAVIVKNIDAFQSRYGTSITILGAYTGSLNNAGDQIVLLGGAREPILDFTFEDEWYPVTDGSGFALTIVDENAPANTWGLASSWRIGSAVNGSPGQADPAPPSRPIVLVTEALTHTDPPAVDVIELHNPTGAAINITGWFLSDDFQTPEKFVIPATTIPAGGYVTFDEGDFNAGGPGSFALSSGGDSVWLFSGDGVNLTGYAHGYRFDAAANGITFGRHVTSVGEDHFVAQTAPSLGASEAGPLVGPMVVSEIHYLPWDVTVGTNGWNNTEDEFIELANTSSYSVPLYDPNYPTNTWRLRDAVDFDFPMGVSVPVGGYVVVASVNPNNASELAAFRARNGVPASVPVYGPFRGRLDNEGDSVELLRPDAPEPPISNNPGFVPYILVERVRYSNVAPWPVNTNSLGLSLQRLNYSTYANDPINWRVAGSSAGEPYSGGTPPGISMQPTNTTVVAYYGQANFTVGSSGTAPLRYQWRFGSLNINDATNSTLTLTNVQPSQAGNYQVIVYNQAGYVASSSASLTVLLPASITTQPTNQFLRGSNDIANYGKTFSNATFRVVANSGNPPVSYQWYHNDVPIAWGTNSTLVVSNVTLADEGEYRALVTDAISTAPTAVARLTVWITPIVVDQPQGITLAVGESTELRTSVRAHPLPIGFRWRRSGANVTNFVGNLTNSVFTLNNARTTDAGTWTVVVTNSAFPAPGTLSSNCYVTVVVPPTNQTANAGANVTLRAAATGTGPTRYQWQFNGADLVNATNALLTVTNVQLANEGTYSAVVSVTANPNTPPIAPATFSAVLSVLGPPTLANARMMANGTFTALIQGGNTNRAYVIEVSTNLTSWSPLTTVPYTNNPTPFTDPGATSAQRFYRARLE